MPAKTAVKMSLKEVMAQLKKLGTEQTKKTYLRHGVREPFFGVKVGGPEGDSEEDQEGLRVVPRTLRHRQLRRDVPRGPHRRPRRMTKADLKKWVKGAYWNMIAGYTVPWVASESRFGRELALDWIDTDDEMIATAGWSTYASLVAIKPDAELDLAEIEKLLGRVKDEIGSAPEPRALHDEQLRDRGGRVRGAADGEGEGDRQGNRDGRGGHGRHVVPGAAGVRLHREDREDGPRRAEEEDGNVLSARSVVATSRDEYDTAHG